MQPTRNESDAVLGHCKAIMGQVKAGLMMNFVMIHVPVAGSLTGPVDQQSSALSLNHGCPMRPKRILSVS